LEVNFPKTAWGKDEVGVCVGANMPSPNILTVRDLPLKIIVDAYRVILIVMLVALPGVQSEK